MEQTKTLQLSLKKNWFEMTKAGIKTEDYREINEHWTKRLIESDVEKPEIGQALCALRDGYAQESVNEIYGVRLKRFDINIMTSGYPKSTDTDRILKLEHKGIEIRTGNPEWGAEPGKLYFVIKHGKILTP
jgi:hypothetical protein